jgi:hypothetical protein
MKRIDFTGRDLLDNLNPAQITIVVSANEDGGWLDREVARMSAAAPNAIIRIAELARQYGNIHVDYIQGECIDLLK